MDRSDRKKNCNILSPSTRGIGAVRRHQRRRPMTEATAERKKTSVIKSKFISHGTLGSTDLDRTRKFYEEFLGLEVVRTSPVSLFVRLGGDHVYAVVKQKQLKPMDRINHNGVDV